MFDTKTASTVLEKQHPLAPPKEASPPPSYTTSPPDITSYAASPPDITAAFANLNLRQATVKPNRDQCIAHLKLLESFHELRENIATQDGLFGIKDDFVPRGLDERDHAAFLVKIREKRWAIYVAKAAKRFESWWLHSVDVSHRMYRVQDTTSLVRMMDNALPLSDIKDNLPPIDVLMVWHTFMLNPRSFTEDCIRYKKPSLWKTGLPWQAIDACIDNETFEYSASTGARQRFESQTGYAWDSLYDSPEIMIACPRCNKSVSCPWTTCDNELLWAQMPDEPGIGYADKGFEACCGGCGFRTTHEILSGMKFRRDVQLLRSNDYCMPGTVFNRDGLFAKHPSVTADRIYEQFPNRLIMGGGAWVEILSVTDPATHGREITLKTTKQKKVSIQSVRDVIEDALSNRDRVKKANKTFRAMLHREERVAIRRMMARYWDNNSIFALDLVGAVIRQSSFIEKMHAIDWIHSPALSSTMDRLLIKYSRYFYILAKYKDQVAVPTLDVDLAWHTHQLSPKAYYDYSTETTGIFIDHDDKIDEDKLSDAFEWTSKTYQKLFNEVYSECTCWYCESIRESHTSTLSRLTTNKSLENDLDRLHSTAQSSDPHKGPHISAHNAIKVTGDDKLKQQNKAYQLERSYQKACKHARKKGRVPPERDAYMSTYAYGYPVMLPYYAPYMGDPCITNG
ncbi:MAG: hypothetical protein Q9191_008211, partial [Dirinaria sp. TL-2023a]